MLKGSSSIVLYNNKEDDVRNVLRSLIQDEAIDVIYIIDNSPERTTLPIKHAKINYIKTNENIGFGKAHNIAINKAIEKGYKYHFVVNPDIFFKKDTILPMLKYMFYNTNVGMMMPKVLNFDGSVQYLPKLLPSIFSLFKRKLRISQEFLDSYELRNNQTEIINVPHLSGCFTLLNLEVIEELGAYDERFFMYFEDWDLSRRVYQKYQTLFYPKVSVYHGYASEANKKMSMLIIFLNSMVKYFNKWGWFKTKESRRINDAILQKVEKIPQ